MSATYQRLRAIRVEQIVHAPAESNITAVGPVAGFVANFWEGRRNDYRWAQLCSERGELLKCGLAIG
jgi:hypothetical protein